MKSMAEELLEKHIEKLNGYAEASLASFVEYRDLADTYRQNYESYVTERSRCTLELIQLRHGQSNI